MWNRLHDSSGLPTFSEAPVFPAFCLPGVTGAPARDFFPVRLEIAFLLDFY